MQLIDREVVLPNGVYYVNADDPMRSLDILLERIASAPTIDAVPVVRWIPVTERLPKPNELVLCIWKRMDAGYYGFARYQHDDVWYVSNEGMPKVTHWMPLPEPPMRKGENG